MAHRATAPIQPATRKTASVQRVEGSPVGWVLSVYPTAGEAGGSFRYAARRSPVRGGPTADPDRAAEEAARRARGKLRRYCTANGLNRLGTLTYRGAGCHDPRELRVHVAQFFRTLRGSLDGRAFPYAWVPEWHKTDHGLHVHFAVGQYVKRSVIDSAWGRGFVHMKLLGDLPVGSGRFEEARKAAGYLGKYVAKTFEDSRRIAGLHRYEVGQGFQPQCEQVAARTVDEAIDRASEDWMGGRAPSYRWSSDQEREWKLPPAVWVSWAERSD